MKIVLAVLMTLALAVGLAFPAVANGGSVTTGANVQTGGGQIPVVKAKWETPDEDPIKAGTQVLPPVVYGGTKTVTYWAVVTDEEDNGDVAQVYVDVYHPAGPPENGSFKYEVPMHKVNKFDVGIPAFNAAVAAGIVTYNTGFDAAEVLFELNKCTAEVWSGSADLSYHQPAGNYLVKCFAFDKNGNLSPSLQNTFEYVAVNGIEIDFTSVNYGSVAISTNKWVAGDTVFGTGGATVRNIGNTDVYIQVTQSDMGFGQDVTGMWNVQFDARLGNNPANEVVYDPFQTIQLPNKLPLCNTEELDFSIHVKKDMSGQAYTGTMTITSSIAPF